MTYVPNEFSNQARSVLPWDVFFRPEDYLKQFNSLRECGRRIGIKTFKYYLRNACESSYFPELFRLKEREEDASAPYLYCLDSTKRSRTYEGSATSNTPAEETVSKNTEKRAQETARVEQFIEEVKPLFTSRGTFYTCAYVRSKHAKAGHRKLQVSTVRHYMSVAYNQGLWKGLSRRAGKNGAYKYRWLADRPTMAEVPKRYPKILPPPPLTETRRGRVPKVEGSFFKEPPVFNKSSVRLTCGSCGEINPKEASFCMHCGHNLSAQVRVVVQESVGTISIPPVISQRLKKGGGFEQVNDVVRDWVMKHLYVAPLSYGDDGENVITVCIGDTKNE